jgi:hypothetical protein
MKHVLSVSYDRSLLNSRELLLRTLGVQVTSALGFTPASQACNQGGFDLLILGNSIPNPDKEVLIHTFRIACPAPIIELHSVNETPTQKAEHSFNAHSGPGEFLDFVRSVLRLEISSDVSQPPRHPRDS